TRRASRTWIARTRVAAAFLDDGAERSALRRSHVGFGGGPRLALPRGNGSAYRRMSGGIAMRALRNRWSQVAARGPLVLGAKYSLGLLVGGALVWAAPGCGSQGSAGGERYQTDRASLES